MTLAGQTTVPVIVVESGALTNQGTLPAETQIVVSRDAQLTDETGMITAVYLSENAEEPAIAITNQPDGGQLHLDGSRTLAMETTTQEDSTFSQLLYILQKQDEEGNWVNQGEPQAVAQFEVTEVGTYRIRIEAWWSWEVELRADEIGIGSDSAKPDLVMYSGIAEVQPYTPPYVPAPTYYTVKLPAVTGAILNPSAGSHVVEEGDSFRLTLILEEGYTASQPEVTTNRGETLTANANGQYLITGIYQDIVVTITGIALDPTANEQIAASETTVSWQDRTLCVESAQPLKAYHIYKVNGEAVMTGLISGTSAHIDGSAWPTGVYVVAIETEDGKRIIYKVRN